MTLSNAEITQDVFKMLKRTSTVSSPQNKEKKVNINICPEMKGFEFN